MNDLDKLNQFLNFDLFPPSASTFATKVDPLFYFLTILSVIATVGVFVALGILGVKFRRDPNKPRPTIPKELISTDIAAAIHDPQVHVVVELIGGTGIARQVVLDALAAGKHVVTANKALLAQHGPEVFECARRHERAVGFEASVAGGIPIIRALAESLAANQVTAIQGILNGTSNFILTSIDDGVELEVAPAPGGQLLRWTGGGPWRANVFYRVYRSEDEGTDCEHNEGSTAVYCFIRALPIATTRETEYLDPAPPPGATYRIGVATNWADDAEQGDVFAFSRPVTAAP